MKKVRIASGAGYAGDRIEPAIDVMKNGNIDYIAFECLAERTIAIAQSEKLKIQIEDIIIYWKKDLMKFYQYVVKKNKSDN